MHECATLYVGEGVYHDGVPVCAVMGLPEVGTHAL